MVYKALLELRKGVSGTENTIGSKAEVQQPRHMVGAAFGWGGLPTYEADYITNSEPRPVGEFRLVAEDVRLNGGACSPERTRLWAQFPDLQEGTSSR